MAEVLSVTMPALLKREVEIIAKTGYYDNSSEFVRDAIRTLLSARKDVRVGVAVELYKEGIISMGKVAEVAEVSYDEASKLLRGHGVKMRGGVRTAAEAKRAAGALRRKRA